MSMVFALLLLLSGSQNAPAVNAATGQGREFTYGIWKGQCWPTGMKGGALCRVTGGPARKMRVMIERRPNRLDLYVLGVCTADNAPETLPQSMFAGSNRVTVLRTAIDLVVLKTNHECRTQEAFAENEADLAAVLNETDMIVAGVVK